MRLEVSPGELDASVEAPVVLQVEVYNSQPVIHGYRATLLGLPGLELTSEPPELSLFPETSGLMVVTFTLPPNFPAGRHLIGVKVASVIDPQESAAREVRLNVAPVELATFMAEPLAVTAGKKAEYSLIVGNQGNVPIEARLLASESTGKLGIALVPPTLALGPGEQGVSKAVAKGRRPFFGSPVAHQLTFTADNLTQPLQAAATFMQKPLIPRGVLTLLSILAALAMWGAVLFLGVNKVADVIEKDNAADAAKAAAAAEKAAQGPYGALAGGGGVLGSVAGTVTAAPDATDATVALVLVPAPGGGSTGPLPPPVTTPPTGEYKIDKVPAGTYQVVFSKVGLGPQSRLVEVAQGQQLTGIDVTLVAGTGAVSGTVSDASGPVGGATVTAFNGADTIAVVTLPTGPIGTFALTGLPTPATYAISVAKAGFGTVTQPLELAEGQMVAGFNVSISRGQGSISGTVLSKAGVPVPDVVVSVRAGAGSVPLPGGPTTTVVDRALTAADLGPDVLGAATSLASGPVGFYSVGGLATPGTYTVTFQREGYLTTTVTAALADNGNESNISPVLQPVTGGVRGIVAQEIARVVPCQPLECRLPEAQVTITDANGAEVRKTTTASSPVESLGRYEIAGLPPGAYTVTFSKTGYVPQTFSITLAQGDPQRALDATLRGVMVAVTGSATNCTSMVVVLRDGRFTDPPVTAPVRPDGSFRIPRLYSPGEYRAVFLIGSTALAATNFDVDAGETGVEVDGFCTPPTTQSPFTTLLVPAEPTTTIDYYTAG